MVSELSNRRPGLASVTFAVLRLSRRPAVGKWAAHGPYTYVAVGPWLHESNPHESSRQRETNSNARFAARGSYDDRNDWRESKSCVRGRWHRSMDEKIQGMHTRMS